MCDVHLVYNGIKFDEAVKAMNGGKKVRRYGWDPSMCLYKDQFHNGQCSEVSEDGSIRAWSRMIQFFCLQIGDSNYHIWHPTQADLVTNDWAIIDDMDKT